MDIVSLRASGVYCIVNLRDGTRYIGSTSKMFRERWAHHTSHLRRGTHSNSYLQRAWDKYGPDAFEFRVVECAVDRLLEREQYWLDRYREDKIPLYNLAVVAGNPMQDRHHSDATREQMRKSNTGKKRSEETRQRIGAINRGRPNSDEQKRKISEALTGRVFSEEHRQKMARAAQGREHTQDTRQKLAAARAKSYPALYNVETGEFIPAGIDKKAMCKRHGLNTAGVWALAKGIKRQYKGWVVYQEDPPDIDL